MFEDIEDHHGPYHVDVYYVSGWPLANNETFYCFLGSHSWSQAYRDEIHDKQGYMYWSPINPARVLALGMELFSLAQHDCWV